MEKGVLKLEALQGFIGLCEGVCCANFGCRNSGFEDLRLRVVQG